MICRCSNDKHPGFRRRSDEVWVHAQCNMPTWRYLEVFMKEKEKHVLTHLNLLQGGPLHNTFLSTSEIIDRVSLPLREDGEFILQHVDEYRWTVDTLTGASGKVARIWRHKNETSTTS